MQRFQQNPGSRRRLLKCEIISSTNKKPIQNASPESCSQGIGNHRAITDHPNSFFDKAGIIGPPFRLQKHDQRSDT
jgi:hypothetical protein